MLIKWSFLQLWFFLCLYSCNSGYVAIDEEGRPDARVFKERYCGPYLPPDTSSKNSRLVLIFNTDNARESRGFSAFYEFIPGIQISDIVVEVQFCLYILRGLDGQGYL